MGNEISSAKYDQINLKNEMFGSLRTKLIGSSIWVIFGNVLSQGLRLAGNLILTRLLFPEAFGLMALVNVVLLGVNAFSDIGLRGSVVHNARGDERSFLNTAWVIQIIRGIIIWCILCVCAWPASIFYKEPQLISLIPAGGLIAIFSGFGSTSLLSLIRQISLRKKVIVEIVTQFVGIVTMIACAFIWKSVWALVAGSLIRPFLLMIWSHFLVPGYRNHFEYDRTAAKEIIHFGKWIFLSTALTFLGSQGDRLILGKIFDANELGIYSIAFFLSQAIVFACGELSGNVLFPVYTKLAHNSISDMKNKIFKIRGSLMLLSLPPICILAIWGQQIVAFLYDIRYVDAGWMLQILAIRAISQTIIITSERVLMAFGDSFRHMLLQLFRVIFMGLGIIIGYHFAKVHGLLIGMVVGSFFEYFALVILMYRYGAWLPRLDAMAFSLSAVIIGMGLLSFS